MNIYFLVRASDRTNPIVARIEFNLLEKFKALNDNYEVIVYDYETSVKSPMENAVAYIVLNSGGQLPMLDGKRTFCIFLYSSMFRKQYSLMKYTGATTYNLLFLGSPVIFGDEKLLSKFDDIELYRSKAMEEQNSYFKATSKSSETPANFVFRYVMALIETNF